MSIKNPTKSLLIVGVHRSGTSLTTNWLSECGLTLGQDLLEGRFDNPNGFFEDTDFVSFHQELLSDNGLRIASMVKEGTVLKVSPQRVEQAKKLLEKFNNERILSWKDPRTTMFLDLWSSLIPDLKILMVYRHYSNVTDSLMRRGKKHFKSFPKKQASQVFFTKYNYPLANRYLTCWNYYNQKMIEYYNENQENCVLYSLDQILENSESIVTQLNDKWDLGFKVVNIKSIFEEKYLTGKKAEQYKFNKEIQSRAEQILKNLEDLQAQNLVELS